MSSYVSVTLDTTGPKGVSVCINGDEQRTTDTQLTLEILCSDSDTTNYQMKIWSDVMEFTTEESAQWEDYSREKIITFYNEVLESKTVTVYVKLRDDVWNESEIASDSIDVYTQTPTVTITVVSRAKISKIPATEYDSAADRLFPRNTSLIGFTVDRDCDDLMIMVVEDINASYDDPSNVLIPTNGSSNIQNADSEILTGSDGMQITSVYENGQYRAYIKGDDLEAASPVDGVKIIKIFAHEADGSWSI